MKPFLGGGARAEYVTVSGGHGVAHIPAGPDIKDASGLGLTQKTVETEGVTVHPIMADPNAAPLAALASLAAAGEMRVPVTATFPLEQAPEAFEAFRAGPLGKITATCSWLRRPGPGPGSPVASVARRTLSLLPLKRIPPL